MVFTPELIANLRTPNRADDLGVPVGLAEDLFMRRVSADRITTMGDTATALCISAPVADQLAKSLRDKAMLEILGSEGRDYRIQLTEAGLRATAQRMASGRHIGPVPVPVSRYHQIVQAQRPPVALDRARVEAAFADLFVEPDLLDQVGPAFLSEGAIFLYGPAGTGKTSLAERMNRLYDELVLIPRYLEVDGQIVSVYDPSLHVAAEDQPSGLDPRWVLCQRPLVLVGGELDLSMLDLRYDRVSGISTAPIGVLANNGILVVDDFGRQAFKPDEILNRWIVPLSRGVDYLRAHTGTKFTVPFELKLVMSTNLDPRSLGDDAFLRRLRNKIFVGPISDEGFAWVMAGTTSRLGVTLHPDATPRLAELAIRELGELRPYLAVDFCQLAVAVCSYDGSEPHLDAAMVDRVAALYFVREASADLHPRPASPSAAPPPRRAGMFTRSTDGHIGHVFAHDIMDGLDELAATLSVDGEPAVAGPADTGDR